MATKKTNSSKVKAPSKTPVKAAGKEKSVEKTKEKSKTVKEAKVVEPPVVKVEPQIMSGKPAKTPKPPTLTKKEKKAVEAAEKADAEWVQLMNQHKATKPVPYVMSDDYPPKSVISHKVLGLGYVVKSQNNRIEVAFREGKKTLITNYKK